MPFRRPLLTELLWAERERQQRELREQRERIRRAVQEAMARRKLYESRGRVGGWS